MLKEATIIMIIYHGHIVKPRCSRQTTRLQKGFNRTARIASNSLDTRVNSDLGQHDPINVGPTCWFVCLGSH